MTEKINKLNKEICHKSGLTGYEETIEKILKFIFESNCTISCCDTCTTSSIEQSKNAEFKSRIKIGFKKPKEKPIHFIWDILHEFGHHLSGLPNGKEKTLDREKEAWHFGLIELEKYSQLIEHKSDYLMYRESCLKTYE